MTIVHVLEKYNTSWGLALIVSADKTYSVGQAIISDAGERYTIHSIVPCTNPGVRNRIGLLVEVV